MQISKVVGLPHVTYAPTEETKEAPNSNKQMIRKPMQDKRQIGNPTQSESTFFKPNDNTKKQLLDGSRLKISKLRIPTRSPVVFRQVSQEESSMSQVLDFLYLGNSRDARNSKSLKRLGITHIINATHDLPNYVEDNNEIKYLRVAVEDNGTADLMPYFVPVIEFIDGAIRSKGCVLVHCQEGISRSASLVVAYIMAHSNLLLVDALTVVSHARPIICPNINFLGQLDKFYQVLQHSSKSNLQSSPRIHQNVEQMITERFENIK
ncbi:hypothetical protein ACTXT7_015123 [Hymenolepis weldensis]